ncbi:MAG: hypothetical protein KTR23_17940 [Rhodospirillales bacterium]|nr:hypothetical protein [Rhodospirillales bacterium]
MNFMTLFMGMRDFLFPVLMCGAMLLGAFTTSAKARIYKGDTVVEPAVLNEAAPESGPTVETVLNGSADADVVKGATNPGGEQGNNYDLVLDSGSVWKKDATGYFVKVLVRVSGSPQKTCSVYVEKAGSDYKTACIKQ